MKPLSLGQKWFVANTTWPRSKQYLHSELQWLHMARAETQWIWLGYRLQAMHGYRW